MEADYEYNSHLEIFNPETKWSSLNLDGKKESIGRLKTKCNEKNLGWANHVAEWKLYQLHKTAATTNKNRSVKQTSGDNQWMIR